METDPDLEKNINKKSNKKNKVIEVIININDNNNPENSNNNPNQSLSGESSKSLEKILPLELWCQIISYLEFNDPALIYYFGPLMGLTKSQAQKIASSFYNSLFKKVKTIKDLDSLIKLNNNCFSSYKHERSKFLLKKLIAEQNLNFFNLKNEYSQIHEKLSFRQKCQMRISKKQQELVDFWNKVLTTIETKYSKQDNLSSLSDEKLLDLSLFILNLKKLYKTYKISGIYLSVKKKAIITVVSLILSIIFISMAIAGEPQQYGHVGAIGLVLLGSGTFWHWFIGSHNCQNIYLKDINLFSYNVELEIARRKQIL